MNPPSILHRAYYLQSIKLRVSALYQITNRSHHILFFRGGGAKGVFYLSILSYVIISDIKLFSGHPLCGCRYNIAYIFRFIFMMEASNPPPPQKKIDFISLHEVTVLLYLTFCLKAFHELPERHVDH